MILDINSGKQIQIKIDLKKFIEKLCSIKPETLGQAMRISGVTPADISVLSVFISKQERVSRET